MCRHYRYAAWHCLTRTCSHLVRIHRAIHVQWRDSRRLRTYSSKKRKTHSRERKKNLRQICGLVSDCCFLTLWAYFWSFFSNGKAICCTKGPQTWHVDGWKTFRSGLWKHVLVKRWAICTLAALRAQNCRFKSQHRMCEQFSRWHTCKHTQLSTQDMQWSVIE